MNKVSRDRAKEIIHNTAGRVFGAEFIKKNGDYRKMTCRLNVKKYLKGGGRAYDPDKYNLVFVFDMANNGYRCIPIDRLQRITHNKEVYNVGPVN